MCGSRCLTRKSNVQKKNSFERKTQGETFGEKEKNFFIYLFHQEERCLNVKFHGYFICDSSNILFYTSNEDNISNSELSPDDILHRSNWTEEKEEIKIRRKEKKKSGRASAIDKTNKDLREKTNMAEYPIRHRKKLKKGNR